MLAWPAAAYDATAVPRAASADRRAPAAARPPTDCDDPTASYAPSAEPARSAMPSGSTMAEIRERGRLIAGVSADTYLLGSRNPLTGEIEGFDIDMVKADRRGDLRRREPDTSSCG